MELEEKIDQYLKFKREFAPPINPRESALIIIDMQNYQVKETSTCVESLEKVVPGMTQYFVKQVYEVVNPNITRLLEFFRQNKIPIYYTKFACRRNDRKDYTDNIRVLNELSENLIGKYVFPSIQDPIADIIPELKPEVDDTIIIKTTNGTFSSTDLEIQLKNLSVTTLIIVGVVTHICVENTARIAFDLGFNVYVVDDACAGWSPTLHNAALRGMELFFVNVITTDKILNKLKKAVKRA
ncbi:MAG: cysteine hydrolase [Promethearchaeota archaeon]|nr:MAG: cysteine hydrolase [Candidatus Lokiarchaeota archaeon]